MSAWHCIDIVRRNSVLVTYGISRVNWQYYKELGLKLLNLGTRFFISMKLFSF